MLKKEVERLVILGLLDVQNDSDVGAPYFAKIKPKSNQLHLLSNFRNINKELK